MPILPILPICEKLEWKLYRIEDGLFFQLIGSVIAYVTIITDFGESDSGYCKSWIAQHYFLNNTQAVEANNTSQYDM